ncbi:MAG: hypothetical protein U0Y82_05930 [Thermoleophilia bacterium]
MRRGSVLATGGVAGVARWMFTVAAGVGSAGAHGPVLPARSTARNCTCVTPSSATSTWSPSRAGPQSAPGRCTRTW